MIKMSRIIFTLRGAVMSYQNGFGGNDLAVGEQMMGGGWGQTRYNKRDLSCKGLCAPLFKWFRFCRHNRSLDEQNTIKNKAIQSALCGCK